MKLDRLRWLLVAALLFSVVALHLAAQVDADILGTMSDPFTTLSVTGELSSPGELDWYTFDVVGDSVTIFILAEGKGDASGLRVLLYEANDTFVAAADEGFLESVLHAGTYRIRIDSTSSTIQSYSLTVLNGLEIESNDGLGESNDLGEIAGVIRLFASAVPAGDADFYRFQIAETGLPNDANAILMRTGGPSSGDTFLVLYRYDDVNERYLPIAFDDDSGEEYWSQLLVRPQPGDRFALRIEETVFPLKGIEKYSLSLIPVILVADDEPNNTSTQATELTSQPENDMAWSIDGLLDGDDTIDFFALTMDTSALVQIVTEPQGEGGDYNTILSLYTLDGTLLAESSSGGDSGWGRVAQSLDAGDYIITVEMDDYETPPVPYRLRAVATPVKTVSETEPNDTDETSERIPWLPGEALLVEGAIGAEGDVDSFQITLDKAMTLIFETSSRSGSSESNDTTLSIYDADLWEIAFNDDANGSWSRVEQALEAGTYYVVVESYYSDEVFDYSLLITSSE